MRFARSLNRPQARQHERAYLVEGVRLVEEALAAGARPELVLVAPAELERTERRAALLAALQPYQPVAVTPRVLASVSDTVAPQGVVAVLPLPRPPASPEPGPLLLALDGVRDPGNVGTILRAAEASGTVGVVALRGCADAFGPKVVRAAMGAHFHLTLLPEATRGDVQRLADGRPVWLATMRGGVPYDEVDWRRPAALIVGGEAAGASDELEGLATGRVSIPMAGRAESLNAAMAASILVFEAARQRRRGAAGERG